MVSLKEIYKAIITQIKEYIKSTNYEGIVFSSKNIEEEIIRPSFYLKFNKNNTSKLNGQTRQRKFSVQIFYFAKTRENSEIEILEMQDILSDCFQSAIKITDDYYIPTQESDFRVEEKDGYLILNLDNLYSLSETEETGELMEELEINNKLN